MGVEVWGVALRMGREVWWHSNAQVGWTKTLSNAMTFQSKTDALAFAVPLELQRSQADYQIGGTIEVGRLDLESG